ncbi:MAG: hypothetical protein M3R08_10760, partial [Bacteroidota bacterium]|nr:hypothetical protein [Bacteroidota bacterium]
MATITILRPLLLSAMMLPLCASAQPGPPGLPDLVINVQVVPPYTASYASYFQVPGQVLITVFNPSPNIRLIYLTGSIATVDGDVAVSIAGRSGWTAPLVIPPGGTVISSTQIEPLVQGNTSDVQYTGITETDIRSGLLPEGEYRICLQAIDWLTEMIASF